MIGGSDMFDKILLMRVVPIEGTGTSNAMFRYRKGLFGKWRHITLTLQDSFLRLYRTVDYLPMTMFRACLTMSLLYCNSLAEYDMEMDFLTFAGALDHQVYDQILPSLRKDLIYKSMAGSEKMEDCSE